MHSFDKFRSQLHAGTGEPVSHRGERDQPLEDGELENLLWLYANRTASKADENQLFRLGSENSDLIPRLNSILKQLEEIPPLELEELHQKINSFVEHRQHSITQFSIANRSPIEDGIDWILQVASDFFCSPQSVDQLALLGGTRGAAKNTSFPKMVLRPYGTFKLIADHIGDSTCHLTVEIDETAGGNDPLIAARLVGDGDSRILEFENGSLRFEYLSTGNYQIELLEGEQRNTLSRPIRLNLEPFNK